MTRNWTKKMRKSLKMTKKMRMRREKKKMKSLMKKKKKKMSLKMMEVWYVSTGDPTELTKAGNSD